MASADIMISYHENDIEFVAYLAESLTKEGLDVWYLKPEHASDPAKVKTKGQVLLNCKVYIVILSPESCSSSLLKDEMSLAYISNKPIYPLGRKYYRKIAEKMEGGVKLMLAKINWTFFVKEEAFPESLNNLVSCIRTDLSIDAPQRGGDGEGEEEDEGEGFTGVREEAQHAPADLYKKRPKPQQEDDEEEQVGEKGGVCEHTNAKVREDFWERHFTNQSEVAFQEFKDRFLDDYRTQIEEDLGADKPDFFVNLLYKDIFAQMQTITRLKYNKFVGRNESRESDHFFDRLRQYAIGSLALREVLNMDSSVRLIAIENLGKFRTPAVIKLLYDFISDPDPNIRAVACLSLAKSGKKGKTTEDRLLQLLEDEDRVVRESACLSLAHMRCERAVSAIIELWRNDAIKHVREAAEIALTRIGGEEASTAIKVTQVLQGEMTSLRSTATT